MIISWIKVLVNIVGRAYAIYQMEGLGFWIFGAIFGLGTTRLFLPNKLMMQTWKEAMAGLDDTMENNLRGVRGLRPGRRRRRQGPTARGKGDGDDNDDDDNDPSGKGGPKGQGPGPNGGAGGGAAATIAADSSSPTDALLEDKEGLETKGGAPASAPEEDQFHTFHIEQPPNYPRLNSALDYMKKGMELLGVPTPDQTRRRRAHKRSASMAEGMDGADKKAVLATMGNLDAAFTGLIDDRSDIETNPRVGSNGGGDPATGAIVKARTT